MTKSVLWDNSTRFIFTLAAAVIGLISYLLIPNRKQMTDGTTGIYGSTGKWLLFAFAFVLIGLAGVLAWEWFRYRVHDLWVGGNLVLYAVLGPALLVVNIITMRAMKNAAAGGDSSRVGAVPSETIDVFAMEGCQTGPVIVEASAGVRPQPAPAPIPHDEGAGEAPKP